MARKRTDFIVIHCAATKPSMDIGRKEIDRWHRANGWRMVGYHFIVRRDGTIEGGREIQDQGAHARGYNHKSIGICMVGGIGEDGQPEDNFTDAQYKALVTLLSTLRKQYPDTKIIGHNEISRKACPSFDVQAKLPSWNLEQPSEEPDLVDDEATNIAKALKERNYLAPGVALKIVSWVIRSGWHITSKT